MRRVLLIILVGLILLGAGIAYFGPSWAEGKIEKKINSLTFLSYDSLNIDVADRSLMFFNLKGKKAGYQGNIKQLKIEGLRLIPILSSQKFDLGAVSVSGLTLEYQMKKKGKKKKSATDSIHSGNEDDIPLFNVEAINIEDAFFTLTDTLGGLVFATQAIATLENFGNNDILKPRTIPSKLSRLELDSAQYFTRDGLYNISISKALFQSELLNVTGVALKSNKEKYELGKYVGHEIEWFNATIDSVSIALSDMESLLGKPKVKKMEIYKPSLLAFRDKRLPFPDLQRPPLVRDILAKKDLTFAFDSISIINGNIVYEVFVKEEKGPGEISFENLNATITGLSSYGLGLDQKPRLIASCKLYGKSNLYADISFPDSPTAKKTLVKGKLLNTDLTIFNRMIQYVSVIEIKSGTSEFLEFDFTHTANNAKGEMKFDYNDLAVSFLREQEAEPDGFMNIVKSLFVNTFVIDRNNNFETDKFRVGKIDFDRDEKKSIFNFWSGSILTGFKSSTGVNATGEKIDVN